MTEHRSNLAQQQLEQKVAVLSLTPVETARRLVQAEEALRKIEDAAARSIHNYSITQEKPEKWVSIGDAVLKVCAPLRDLARDGLTR